MEYILGTNQSIYTEILLRQMMLWIINAYANVNGSHGRRVNTTISNFRNIIISFDVIDQCPNC